MTEGTEDVHPLKFAILQAIKGKVISWTEAHGKFPPGSFLLASILG